MGAALRLPVAGAAAIGPPPLHGRPVRGLLLIAEALRCGYRAGEVVALPVEGVGGLLRQGGRVDEASGELVPDWLQRVLGAGRRFDREAVAGGLQHGAAILGRPVVLACLPGEPHRMGLQIAALVIAAAGRSETVLGISTPVEKIVEAAVTLEAAAVGLSVSRSAASAEAVAAVAEVRRRLPARTRLWLGGSGARGVEILPVNIQVVGTVNRLDRAPRALVD